MSDEATGKGGKTWLYVLGAFVLTPLLYLLSVGPMMVLMARGIISGAAFEAIYTPVELLVEQTSTRAAVGGYVMMWFRITGTPEP